MKLSSLLFLVILSSCSIGRKVGLKQHNYNLGKEAKLTVNSLNRVDGKLVVKLLGISLGHKAVAIKEEDISCGIGDETFLGVSVKGFPGEIIYFPKTKYQEFTVTCTNRTPEKVKGTPFMIFKNIYATKDQELTEVIQKDVKIELK